MNHLGGCPAGLIWNYDRLETIADGVVHAVGLTPGLGGAVTILIAANNSVRGDAFVYLFVNLAGPLAILALSSTDDLPGSFQVSRRAAIPRYVPMPKLLRKHSGASPSSRLSPL
jgi:hypothetical protein